jgi:hypothetical protein
VEELLLQARWKTIEYDADNTMLAQIAEAGVGAGEGEQPRLRSGRGDAAAQGVGEESAQASGAREGSDGGAAMANEGVALVVDSAEN